MNRVIIAAALLGVSAGASAVTLVQTSDPGFYNNQIGNLLDNTNGGNTPTGYFPTSDDSTVNFPIAPDLSAAGSVLGNWLADPQHLNGHWSATQIAIPNSWAVSTEVAIIYRFDTLGATNVVAKFGVDNGIFVWIDGAYVLGARAAGVAVAGEYQANLGNLAAGSHYLQLLLEDHGGTNGYDVNITADSFIPGPPPSSVPLPGALGLFAAGAAIVRSRRTG